MKVQTFKGVNYEKIKKPSKPISFGANKFWGCPPKPCQRPNDRQHKFLSWA